jgi:hypothetical protein
MADRDQLLLLMDGHADPDVAGALGFTKRRYRAPFGVPVAPKADGLRFSMTETANGRIRNWAMPSRARLRSVRLAVDTTLLVVFSRTPNQAQHEFRWTQQQMFQMEPQGFTNPDQPFMTFSSVSAILVGALYPVSMPLPGSG